MSKLERGDQLRLQCFVMSMSVGMMYSSRLLLEPHTPNRRSHMGHLAQVQKKREVQELQEIMDNKAMKEEGKVNQTEDLKVSVPVESVSVPLLNLLSASENIDTLYTGLKHTG